MPFSRVRQVRNPLVKVLHKYSCSCIGSIDHFYLFFHLLWMGNRSNPSLLGTIPPFLGLGSQHSSSGGVPPLASLPFPSFLHLTVPPRLALSFPFRRISDGPLLECRFQAYHTMCYGSSFYPDRVYNSPQILLKIAIGQSFAK